MLFKGFRARHSRHITPSEFYDALLQVWRLYSRPLRRKEKIGIAISGGVDSMALASLCQKLTADRRLNIHRLRFRPFVVDHQSRNGSAVEAQNVCNILGSMGFSPVLLTLQWPLGVKPSELPSFETQARRLRFQALGKACRDHAIRSLLLGHHGDDQAETVLMRLASGHRGVGLQGITPFAEIPECWGLHGVHQSGEREFLMDILSSRKRGNKDGRFSEEPISKIEIECGGIQIHRPFLPFSKARLIATCQYYKTSWVEDATNQDVCMTRRNAVRHLLNSDRLPKALQKESLIKKAQRVRVGVKDGDTRAEKLLQGCEVVNFDTRTGRLVIRLPSHKTFPDTKAIPKEYLERRMIRMRRLAGLLLRRLIEMVTPQENVNIRSMDAIVKIVFPKFAQGGFTDLHLWQGRSGFTIGGVQFSRNRSPATEVFQNKEQDPVDSLDPNYLWTLERQPYTSNARPPTIAIPSAHSHDPNPHEHEHEHEPDLGSTQALDHSSSQLSRDRSSPRSSTSDWSQFHLWDGRFWIRLANFTPSTLYIRPLLETDLKQFRNELSLDRRRIFDNSLATTAKGKLRYTLPVIAKSENDGVLAVPTLGMVPETVEPMIGWEVRYKKVNLGMVEGERVVFR